MKNPSKTFLIVGAFFTFWTVAVASKNVPLLPTLLPIPEELKTFRSVNVALLIDVPTVSVATQGSYEIHEAGSKFLTQGKGPLKAILKPTKDGIEMNGELYPTKSLVLKVSSGFIQVEKRTYPDRIRILRSSEKTLTVINQLDVDEYLKGVLPLEVHHDWSIESLKAHAVVSRTFALFKSIEKRGQDFALRDTVESQVYGGSLFHKAMTDQAVESTRGEVLTFRDHIFPAYFHASCGGRTILPERIWAVHPNAVFQEVTCSFCKNSKHWRWSFTMPLSDIEAVMQKKGYPAKNLKRIFFKGRDSSGRVSNVILEYERSQLTILALNFRVFLGYDRLRSLKAWVEVKNSLAHFHGFGWGHGIGFCQWGAKRQAELGKTYHEIIEFYFPRSEIKKVY